MFPVVIGAAAVGMGMYVFSFKKKPQPQLDKKLRDQLSEHQLDSMINDSFPASDPPSTY